ncbi:hypothetical protein Tco_1545829, partial [Tanacetum coccineum]
VMAISVISVSSDSSEDSVGTPAGQAILFDTVPTTIPDPIPVITPPNTQTDTTSDPSEDPSSDHIPPLPAILPFLSSADDTQTQLDVRHSVDHSSLDSSLEASSDFHSDASSDSSSRHLLPDHSSPDLPSTSAGPSHKRRRSPMTYVPALPPVSGALSPVRADLIPSHKRIMSPESATDLKGCLEDSFEPYVPREVGLGVDIEDESSEQSRFRGTDIEADDDVERSDRMDINPVEAVIEACFDFAGIIRASGVDVRVEAVTVARDDVEMGMRDPIIVSDDGDTPPVVPEVIPDPAQEGAAGSTEKGHRIVGVKSAVTALTERIAELERDNRRLRGTAIVESQRFDRLQRGMSRMQRELRQIRRFRFYNRVRVGRFEACARKHMGYRP